MPKYTTSPSPDKTPPLHPQVLDSSGLIWFRNHSGRSSRFVGSEALNWLNSTLPSSKHLNGAPECYPSSTALAQGVLAIHCLLQPPCSPRVKLAPETLPSHPRPGADKRKTRPQATSSPEAEPSCAAPIIAMPRVRRGAALCGCSIHLSSKHGLLKPSRRGAIGDTLPHNVSCSSSHLSLQNAFQTLHPTTDILAATNAAAAAT